MRPRALLVAAALALSALGAAGAYSYVRDYAVHRGFSTLAQLPRAGTGRLLSVSFYSPSLHRDAGYLVYLPPGYTPARRYPVYYLLHGAPGRPAVYVDIANMDVRLDNQLSLGTVRPMILVYPDGRIAGSTYSDSEWANTPAGNFESYVLDVVHSVDHQFSTLADRQDRVLAGFSAGAYGAINIALHHLPEFANVQTWSGYFTQTATGVFARASRADLAYNSPIDYAGRIGRALARSPLRLYMFAGRDDGASHQQLPMARALQSVGAEVQSRLYPGGHDWSVWYPRLNQMLILASRDVAHPPSAATRHAPDHAALAPPAPHVASAHRHHPSQLGLVSALVLALISAALINLGFVLQHRGHAHAQADGRNALASGFRQPVWLLGQAVGWVGFAGQIAAVALAPLTLVQAFSAGSLALSVPVAARLFGHRVRAGQLAAIAVIALSLASLPIGAGAAHGHLHGGLLIATALLAILAGGLIAPPRGAAALAIATGVLYGSADAAIKAAAIAINSHGGGPIATWTLLAAITTLAGFLSFQAALRRGEAVQTLSLMNALTALTAVTLGLVAFGEPLGASPSATILHAVAILAVLTCVRPLAGAQQQLAQGAPPTSPPPAWPRHARPRIQRLGDPMAALRVLGGSAFGMAALILCSVTALGLLYEVRNVRWLAFGPRVPDALPLLQLAGFDGQPSARVSLAALLAGLMLGTALIRVERRRRAILTGTFVLLLMLVGSDASYALARNLPLDQVLLNRSPGAGPWLQGLLCLAASALPGQRPPLRLPAGMSRLRARPVLVPMAAAGVAVIVAGSLVMPSGHARAQLGTAPTRPTARPAGSPALPRPFARPARSPALSRPSAPPALVHLAAPPAATGRLLTIHFYSRALQRVADYLVYLPAAYNRARRLPVFYMLHGMPGRPLAFTANADVEAKLEALIRHRRVRPMILAFPDGRIGGDTQSDSEWANTSAGRFENYVVNVIHDVDHRFATHPDRRDRAIAGLSAGAYGAANIGLHQIAMLGLIQVWSGYFIQTRSGVFAHAGRAELAYNSPLKYVRTMHGALAGDPLHVFLYVGTDDSDRVQVKPMAAALATVGAHVHYAIYPGGHSWDLWAPRVDQMLIMASRYFARPATSARARVSGPVR